MFHSNLTLNLWVTVTDPKFSTSTSTTTILQEEYCPIRRRDTGLLKRYKDSLPKDCSCYLTKTKACNTAPATITRTFTKPAPTTTKSITLVATVQKIITQTTIQQSTTLVHATSLRKATSVIPKTIIIGDTTVIPVTTVIPQTAVVSQTITISDTTTVSDTTTIVSTEIETETATSTSTEVSTTTETDSATATAWADPCAPENISPLSGRPSFMEGVSVVWGMQGDWFDQYSCCSDCFNNPNCVYWSKETDYGSPVCRNYFPARTGPQPNCKTDNCPSGVALFDYSAAATNDQFFWGKCMTSPHQR